MKKLRNIQKNNVDNNKTNSKFFVYGKEFFAKFFCNKYFITLRFQLIVAFLIPISFIIILGFVSFQKASSGIKDNYEKSTSQALSMTGSYIQFGLDSALASFKQFTNDDRIKKYFAGLYENDIIEKNKNKTEISNMFEAKKMTEKFIEDIYIISDKYTPISTMKQFEDNIYTDFITTDTGKYLKENPMKILWLGWDSYLDEKLTIGPDKYALRMVGSIKGTNSILIMDIDNKSLQNILSDLKFDKTGFLAIVTADGKEITADEYDDKDEPSVKSESNKDLINDDTIFTDQEFYKIAANGESKQGYDYVKFRDKEYLFMYYKIGESGALICGLIPNSTIVKQADGIKRLSVVIVMVSCMIGIGVAIIISNGIDKTIKVIISKLRIAAKGDLTVKFNIKRKDEFHVLIDEIQNMFHNMTKLIEQVKTLSNEVSESSTDVITTSQIFLKSTEDISCAINEIEQGISQQARDAEECLNQMDNLSNRILLVSDNVKEINKIADSTKKSIQQGTITTEDLNIQTKETMKIAVDIITVIQNLEQKSVLINKIINVISEIANQTNLLSLNASIEAARAGEAGRGFSIVASEIRTLADQSKNSVNSIKEIISGIQIDTKNAVITAKKAADVIILQENAVINTTESYKNINESVENLIQFLEQITENVDNIEIARITTLGAIENISAVLEEIAASTNIVNQTVGEQLLSVESLNNSASSLDNNAVILVEAVDKFKV